MKIIHRHGRILIADPTLPTSPATGPTTLLAMDVDWAFHDTNSQDAYATLLDSSTPVTSVAPNFGNWAHDTSQMHFPFRPQRATRLDRIEYIDLFNQANSANGTYPIKIYQKVQGKDAALIATFTGANYDQQTWVPVACDSSAITEELYFDIQGTQAVFPHRLRCFGAQLAYTPPAYDPVAEQIAVEVFNNGNAYEYCENGFSNPNVAYGSVDPAKTDINSHTGGLRDYTDWNDTVRLEDIDATGGSQIAWRNNPDHAGYRKVDVIQAIKAKGYTYRYAFLNNRSDLAATFPGYVDEHPYVPAYTDSNGNQVPAQPAKPWLNSMNTCIPTAYGRDYADPLAYPELAEMGFQVALELGSGTLTDPSLSKFATFAAHPSYQPAPTPIRNAGLIATMSYANEETLTFKWIWQYSRPQWTAAQQSAINDGHKGALGAYKGVKAADPNFGITGMPPHLPLPRYQKAVQYFDCKLRGIKANGKVDASTREVEFHYYPLKAVAPHYGLPLEKAEELGDVLHLRQVVYEDYGNDVRVVLGELGYTSDSTAMELSDNTAGRSYVPPSGGYTSEQLVAAYYTRAIWTAPELGLAGIGLYSLRNKNGATAGTGAKWDDVQGMVGTLSEKHVAQALTRVKLGYQYAGTFVNPIPTDGSPRPDGVVVQRYTKAGLNDELKLWTADLGYATGTYSVNLPYGGKLRTHNATGFTLTEAELPAGANTIAVDSFPSYVEVYSSAPGGGTTPPPSTAQPTMTVTFASPAEAQAATLTPTAAKYNKAAVFMYDHDDGGLDFYSQIFPYLKAKGYTDGTGGQVYYKGTGGIQAKSASQAGIWPDGGTPGKYTWSNMLEMVTAGWDMALHSYDHTDTNAASQVQMLYDLAKNRFTALGSNYVLRAGIVPNNYADYINPFINIGVPPGGITSQGTTIDPYPILPQYSENVTFQYSQIPTSGHYVMRRSLTDPNSTPLSTEQAAIDDLVTGTPANPKLFRCFSHQVTDGLTTNLFDYVAGKPGDLVWVPSLREYAEYNETKAGTVITKAVSGNTATFTLDQSALSPNVRWRDLSFTLSGGTITGLSQTGAQGARYSGSLINFFNTAGQLPPLAS